MTRILITAVVSCVLSGGIGYLLLPVLRALKAGQSIREIGPTWHNAKAGTPMMGGLMFILASVVVMIIHAFKMEEYSGLSVFCLIFCVPDSYFFRICISFSRKQKKEESYETLPCNCNYPFNLQQYLHIFRIGRGTAPFLKL